MPLPSENAIAWPVSVAEGEAVVEVDEAVYPAPAVQGAALLFIPRAWVRIAAGAPGRARVTLRPRPSEPGGASDGALAALGGELCNELIHQALRLDVGARTEKLREMVIGKAVMSAEQAPPEPVRFVDDPLGIGRPWQPPRGDGGGTP